MKLTTMLFLVLLVALGVLILKSVAFGGKQKRKHEDRKNVKWQRQESRSNNRVNRDYTRSKTRYYDRRD